MTGVSPDYLDQTDPYIGQEKDDLIWNPCVLICHIISFIYPPALVWAWYFPFHNYRQIHVGEIALTSGWNAPPRDGTWSKLAFPQIPECPSMWKDVSHYWNFGATVGIILYEILAVARLYAIKILLVVGLFIAMNLGKITPQQAITIFLQQIGIIF